MVTRGIIFPISKKAMTRRVGLLEWQRELRVVKAVQEGRLKMDLEPPGRMVKPAGTARYSSRVFMALSGVPVKSSSGNGGEKKSGNTVIHRLSISRDDFFISTSFQGGFSYEYQNNLHSWQRLERSDRLHFRTRFPECHLRPSGAGGVHGL